MNLIPPPEAGTYPAYYNKYFDLIDTQNDVLTQMHRDADRYVQFINHIPDEKFTFRYQPEKWSVAHVLQHIIDTERILSTRAMCIARGEKNSLPGFDEDEYNKNASVSHKNKQLLALEWMTVRQASFSLFAGLTDQELTQKGFANNSPVSVNAIAYMIVAHAKHHFNVIHERYLKP